MKICFYVLRFVADVKRCVYDGQIFRKLRLLPVCGNMHFLNYISS